LTFTTVVPELHELGGTYFTENFSVMIAKHIFNNWSTTTGVLAKPSAMEGQSQALEFRAGLIDDSKQLQVTVLQGNTRVGMPDGSSGYLQTGQKHNSFLTQVLVTLRATANVMGDISDRLRTMEYEILNICMSYKQTAQTGNMKGIKDLIYETGDRVYLPDDEFDKSDWRSVHSIVLWYTLADVQS